MSEGGGRGIYFDDSWFLLKYSIIFLFFRDVIFRGRLEVDLGGPEGSEVGGGG